MKSSGTIRVGKTRTATFRISKAVTATESLGELFIQIHEIVAGLMKAQNFYIALYDEVRNEISYPYFVDEADPAPPPEPPGRTLTAYVLKSGRPLLASPEVFNELVAAGDVEIVGLNSIDWLGVPLKARGRAYGVLAVQSYSSDIRYTAEDLEILLFVADQVGLAIERKRNEEALRESEARNQALLRALPDLLFVIGKDGRFLDVQKPQHSDLLMPREKVIGRHYAELLPAELTARLDSALQECLASSGDVSYEYDLEVGGEQKYFEARLVPYGSGAVLALVRNISERKRSEAIIRRTQADLKRLTDNMLDVISETDLEGRFLFVSPSLLNGSGWNAEDLLGKDATAFVHPSERATLIERLKAGTGRESKGTLAYRWRCSDGRYIWVETSSSLLKDAGGLPQGWVFVSRDVTERKRSEMVLGLLQEVDRKILQYEGIDAILDFVCREISSRLEYPLVWVGMKEPDGRIRPRACAGASRDYLGLIPVRWDNTLEGQGPAGKAVRTGTPQVIQEVNAESFDRYADLLKGWGLASIVAFPLISKTGCFGALLMYSSKRSDFDVRTQNLLQRFADQLALSFLESEHLERIQLQTAALEATANAVMITDREGNVEWVNPAFTELTGYSREEVEGQTPRMLKSGIQNDHFYTKLWEIVKKGQVWRGELYNRRKDGSIYVEEQTVTPVRGADGAIHHFVAIKQDVTARRKTEERIRHLALHDPLTDLPNRRAMEESLERIITSCDRGGRGGVFLLLDLDNFKVINDSLGHPAGDKILLDLTRLLKSALRPGDQIARFGGDEFVVLLEGATAEAGRVAAERLRQAVDQHSFQVNERSFDLSISVGAVPIDGLLELPALISLADSALYTSKEKGRNRVTFLDSGASQNTSLAHASQWATRIKTALKENLFFLMFQPICRLKDLEPVHYEALLRLRGVREEPVSPGAFLGAAERFGLLPQIDHWVIRHALAILEKRPGFELFVNISGASLNQEGLLVSIESDIRSSGIAFGQLGFEITETTAVSDVVTVRKWMRRLRELGCRFALDDFGMGFSSFAYLQTLPADFVKIDGAFIRDLDTNLANRALVRAIDTVAETMGKETIAESVEDVRQVPLLLDLGIGFGQGYALGKPMLELPGGDRKGV